MGIAPPFGTMDSIIATTGEARGREKNIELEHEGRARKKNATEAQRH